MSRLPKIASLALVLGVLAQVGLAQVPFVRHQTPGLPPSIPLATLATPASALIRAHVPPGEPVVEVTPTHDIPSFYYYYRLSAALVARNAVWWAVPARRTHVTDWWQDVSGGPEVIRRLVTALRARYVVFSGEAVPAALQVARVWRTNSLLAVAELASVGRGTSRSAP
jgi:hypothetical protein